MQREIFLRRLLPLLGTTAKGPDSNISGCFLKQWADLSFQILCQQTGGHRPLRSKKEKKKRPKNN